MHHNHTPGPWYVKTVATDTPELPGSEQHATVAHQPTGSLVAIVSLKGMAAVDNANAALIAAAPELLEALREVVAEATAFEEKRGYPMARPWVRLARAAIAKAEGRAQQ